MATGRKLKGAIMAAGLRVWDVAEAIDMDYSKLSCILNDRRDATVNELAAIERVINEAEAKGQG